MFKKLSNLLLTLVCVFILSACNSSNADAKEVYVNSISFVKESINLYIGNSYELKASDIIVDPSNANVGYTFSTNDSNVIALNNNTITALSVGVATVKVSALTDKDTYVFDTLIVNVNKIPTYVTSCYFDKSSVTIQLGETASNGLNFNSNTDYIPEISYAKGGIVEYDYTTGIITTLHNGSDTVTATYRIGADDYRTVSFEVNVITYITGVIIDNASDTLIFYVGATGKFNYIVAPSDATIVPVFNGSSIFEVDSEGNYRAVMAGETKFTISYLYSEGNTATNEYSVKVINKPTLLDVAVSSGSHFAACDGVDTNLTTYTMTISSDVDLSADDLTKLNFDTNTLSAINVLNKTISNGDIVVTYTYKNAGSFDMVAHFSDVTYDDSISLTSKVVNVDVHNIITSVSVSADSTIISDNKLDLYLCGIDTHVNSTTITAVPNVSDSLGVNMAVEDTNVISLNDGLITALSTGTTTLTITTVDGYLEDLVITINVLECEAEDIEVVTTMQLYLHNNSNTNSDTYPNSKELIYTVLPTCIDISSVEIKSNNDNVLIEEGRVVANKVGESEITLTSGSITKVVVVTVSALPNKAVICYDGKIVNNSTAKILPNMLQIFDVEFYNDDTKLNIASECSLNSNMEDLNISYVDNALYVTATSLGEANITCNFNTIGILVEFALNVVESLDVPATEIVAQDTMNVNFASAETFTFDFNVLPSDTTDTVIVDYDDAYLSLTGNTFTLASTCANIIVPVNTNVTITAGEITKIVNIKIYNFTTISTLAQLKDVASNTGAYGLANDIDVSGLTTLDELKCLIIGNGFKLTNLNTTFTRIIGENAGFYEVEFSEVNIKSLETLNSADLTTDDTIPTASGTFMLACINSGVITNVAISGDITADGFAFVGSNVETFTYVDINVNLITSSYNGVVYGNIGDFANCNISLNITASGTLYLLGYTLSGNVDALTTDIKVSCNVDNCNVYILARTITDATIGELKLNTEITTNDYACSPKASRTSGYANYVGNILLDGEEYVIS